MNDSQSNVVDNGNDQILGQILLNVSQGIENISVQFTKEEAARQREQERSQREQERSNKQWNNMKSEIEKLNAQMSNLFAWKSNKADLSITYKPNKKEPQSKEASKSKSNKSTKSGSTMTQTHSENETSPDDENDVSFRDEHKGDDSLSYNGLTEQQIEKDKLRIAQIEIEEMEEMEIPKDAELPERDDDKGSEKHDKVKKVQQTDKDSK